MTTTYLPAVGATDEEIEAAVDRVLAEATLDEKVVMLSGRGAFAMFREDGAWAMRPYPGGGGIERLGIPMFQFCDGPRGVAPGRSTCFPCSMARGASFDPDLEQRIGEAIGAEARAQGCNLSAAVCVNLLRHPAWGRAQETYGEDPWHLGVMGAALGVGVQAHNVIATVKHFALNSMENSRFHIDVTVDERTLHEIYLPHFRYILNAGVATVMSAYNKVNGEYCGQDRRLLTDILRGEWRFDGFVHSDWVMGVRKVYGVAAGLDLENPEPLVWGEKLRAAVEGGAVEPQAIDLACRRILRIQFRFASREDPLPSYGPELVASATHTALAREAAEKSAVLLENDGVLPLDRAVTARVAVLGRLAALENTGDEGSSNVRPPYVVTALEGLRAYLGEEKVVTGDESDLEAARAAAAGADVAIVVVGYTAQDEGEFVPGDLSMGAASDVPDVLKAAAQERKEPQPPKGGDRARLGLPAEQVALIEAAAASGKPVVVVIVAGSAVLVEDWRERAGAIFQTFYAGMEGGTALACLLFGEANPSGKLPFTVARNAADYPFFDRDAKSITYDYWHGYAKFDREGLTPRYPFGHGLSYARFSYRAPVAALRGDRIEASVAVRNDGTCEADEVVQCYIGVPGRDAERPDKLLRAFQRVRLRPGETKLVRLSVPVDSLRWRDPTIHGWRLERGRHRVLLGGSSAALLETSVEI